MYDQSELDLLVKAMRATRTSSLTIRSKGRKLRLSLSADETSRVSMPRQPIATVISSAIGMFHPRGTDDGLTPLEPQTQVNEGEVLGYVAQGSALAALITPVTGRIKGELPVADQICGYGDILFTIGDVSCK